MKKFTLTDAMKRYNIAFMLTENIKSQFNTMNRNGSLPRYNNFVLDLPINSLICLNHENECRYTEPNDYKLKGYFDDEIYFKDFYCQFNIKAKYNLIEIVSDWDDSTAREDIDRKAHFDRVCSKHKPLSDEDFGPDSNYGQPWTCDDNYM